MRGQLAVGNAIVREIRPIDVIQAINVVLFNGKEDGDVVSNKQWSAALFMHSDLIEGEVTDEVNAAFSFVNRTYLKNDVTDSHSNSTSTQMSCRKLKALQSALMKECAALQHHGQSECWLYGWTFFKSVQSLYQEK